MGIHFIYSQCNSVSIKQMSDLNNCDESICPCATLVVKNPNSGHSESTDLPDQWEDPALVFNHHIMGVCAHTAGLLCILLTEEIRDDSILIYEWKYTSAIHLAIDMTNKPLELVLG